MSSIEQRVERFEDRREIKNIMGKYVTSCLLCREDTLVDTLFAGRDDISVGFNNGYYVGREAVKGYYSAVCEATAKKSKVLQEIFPDQLGKLSDEELYGVGPFKAEPLNSFYMQEAEDLQTAKAIWMVEGSITDITEKGPITSWVWRYYAADFIKEDGTWNIWHMIMFTDIACPLGQNWGTAKMYEHEGPEAPAPTEAGELYKSFGEDYVFAINPEMPEPYDTFANTFSY